jgi:hypothetical protein
MGSGADNRSIIMIGELTIDPETGEVNEVVPQYEHDEEQTNNKPINNKQENNMECLIFNTDFVQNTKPAATLDPFLQALVEEQSTKNARSIESKARQQALRVLLASACRTKGGLELNDIMGRLRQLWLTAEMQKRDPTISGVSEGKTLNFVFNSVLGGVLREVATRLTKLQAMEWDEELHALNNHYSLEVYPTQNVGGTYVPVTLESISFMVDPVGGNEVEPYAGTNPFEA